LQDVRVQRQLCEFADGVYKPSELFQLRDGDQIG
jgi:hypothetical protein